MFQDGIISHEIIMAKETFKTTYYIICKAIFEKNKFPSAYDAAKLCAIMKRALRLKGETIDL